MLSGDHGYTFPSETKPLVFRINENGIGPEVVRDILLDRGWEEFIEGEMEEYDWNLWWRTNRFRLCDYNDLMPWQRLNHFPKTVAITKKDTLARNMRRMRGVYGTAVYNFSPLAFNLPNDYTKFVAEYSKLNQESGAGSQKSLWICKPADMSRGRGIFIFRDLSELTYDCSAVAQRYLTNPLLIGGYKFDLRIYVFVTSFNPLHIYMYQEGIARFSTEKFDLTSLGNMFSHLTNTSINKLGPAYTTFKEGIGPGCKWSLTMLRNYFHQQGIDDEVLWQRICNIVTLTMLAQAPTVPKATGCVELFGFDILVDDNLKPWLLEVNFSPALGLDCTIDHTIKRALINDILDLMQFQDGDENRGGEQFTKLKQKQAYGSNKRGKISGVKRAGQAKPALRSKSSTTSIGRTPSRLSLAGGRGSVSKMASNNKLTISEKVASPSVGASRAQGTMSVQKQVADNLEDDYDEEIATACERTSSEVNIKGVGQVAQGHQSGKPGSALSALLLPSLEESRKQLDSRRELIRSRQEQKQVVPTPPSRKQSVSSLRQHSTSNLSMSRSGTRQSGIRSSQSQSRVGRASQNLGSTGVRQSNHNTNADTSGRTPGLSNNSRAVLKGQDIHLKRTPSVNKPVLSKTGLKSSVTDGPSSIMNAKWTSTSKNKSKEQHPSAAKPKQPALPPQRVGDFVLTFPFNEATRRASFPSLDIRTIIRETQKLLRRTICKAHSTKRVTQAASRATTQRAAGAGTRQQFEEVVIQWVPLKSQTLLSGVSSS